MRPHPDVARIQASLREGIDYSRLVSLAGTHGVRPSLIRRLRDLSWQSVPSDTRSYLEAFERDHQLHALNLVGELNRVAALFSESGIPFISFKGPVLAIDLYGDLALREYNDIDIIVAERHIAEAEQCLMALSYHNAQGDFAFRQTFLASQHQYRFSHTDSDAAVDLHWGFSGVHVPFPLDPDDAWNDQIQTSIGGRSIRGLADENLALLLAGHGTKEGWEYLKWVCDFAHFIERAGALDWLDIHRRAQKQGCGDSVLLGCSMAQALLETPVPDAIAPLVERRNRVIALTASLTDRMRQGLSPPAWEENFADLDLCDGPFDRFKGALKLIFTPTTGDHAAFKLPQPLWPAYYATRPFRLATSAIAGLFRRTCRRVG